MVYLKYNETTGKQIVSIIKKAIKARSKALGMNVHVTDFCNVSGISRQQIHDYNNGGNPGMDGLKKIAAGLEAWGNEVTINI